MFRTLVGFIWLFLLGTAAFFLVIAPIEIKKTYDAWSWLPRKVKITASTIKHVRGEGRGHTLKISVQEVDDAKQRGSARVRFGDIGHNIFIFSRRIYSSLDADQARYPVGTELVAYRDPQTNQYALEQNDLSLLSSVWICSLLWLLLNGYWLKSLGRGNASGLGT